MIKARKAGKTVGRRSALEKQIEDFINVNRSEIQEGLHFGTVFIKSGVVLSRTEIFKKGEK